MKKYFHFKQRSDRQLFIRLFASYGFCLLTMVVLLGYAAPRLGNISAGPTLGLIFLSALASFLRANQCFKKLDALGDNPRWKGYYIGKEIMLAKSAVQLAGIFLTIAAAVAFGFYLFSDE